MRTLITAMCVFFHIQPALADVIRIETNHWLNKRPLTWSGVVEEIEPQTGMVRFVFQYGDETREVRFHVSRLYSLEFDSRTSVNRDFPPTRQDLETKLGSNPNRKDTLEMTDERNVTDAIPEKVRVRKPDANSLRVYVSGEIKAVQASTVVLSVRTINRKDVVDLEVERSDLTAWIRGS